MLHVLKNMVHVRYWLNFRANGKNWTGTGQREGPMHY